MLKNLFFKSIECEFSGEEIDILRLIRSENVGPKTFFSLIKLFGNVKAALEKAPELSLKGGRIRPIKICTTSEIEREIDALSKKGARLITYKSADYPHLLAYINDFPPVLTCLGNIELLKGKCFGIVGSRNASANGRSFTAKIAQELVQQRYVIVSGLARGIDTAAHHAALGSTIAVIAGGIDHIYPLENTKLYNEMVNGAGLILAEGQIGSRPLSQHFPQRNRLISGLSHGILVVEANLKSGSLITARCALEQNREIFAVPGFPLDPRCQGTNKLIKEGAILVESTEDIISNLSSYDIEKKCFEEKINCDNKYKYLNIDYLSAINDEMRSQVTEMLSATPVSLEVIIEETKFPLPVVYLIILELELAGRVSKLPGNRFILTY